MAPTFIGTNCCCTAERCGDEVVIVIAIVVASDFLFHGYPQGGGVVLELSTVLDGDAAAVDRGLASFSNVTSRNDGIGIDAHFVVGSGKSRDSIALTVGPVGNFVPVTIGGKHEEVILGLE